jgi:hypothetical protein
MLTRTQSFWEANEIQTGADTELDEPPVIETSTRSRALQGSISRSEVIKA